MKRQFSMPVGKSFDLGDGDPSLMQDLIGKQGTDSPTSSVFDVSGFVTPPTHFVSNPFGSMMNSPALFDLYSGYAGSEVALPPRFMQSLYERVNMNSNLPKVVSRRSSSASLYATPMNASPSPQPDSQLLKAEQTSSGSSRNSLSNSAGSIVKFADMLTSDSSKTSGSAGPPSPNSAPVTHLRPRKFEWRRAAKLAYNIDLLSRRRTKSKRRLGMNKASTIAASYEDDDFTMTESNDGNVSTDNNVPDGFDEEDPADTAQVNEPVGVNLRDQNVVRNAQSQSVRARIRLKRRSTFRKQQSVPSCLETVEEESSFSSTEERATNLAGAEASGKRVASEADITLCSVDQSSISISLYTMDSQPNDNDRDERINQSVEADDGALSPLLFARSAAAPFNTLVHKTPVSVSDAAAQTDTLESLAQPAETQTEMDLVTADAESQTECAANVDSSAINAQPGVTNETDRQISATASSALNVGEVEAFAQNMMHVLERLCLNCRYEVVRALGSAVSLSNFASIDFDSNYDEQEEQCELIDTILQSTSDSSFASEHESPKKRNEVEKADSDIANNLNVSITSSARSHALCVPVKSFDEISAYRAQYSVPSANYLGSSFAPISNGKSAARQYSARVESLPAQFRFKLVKIGSSSTNNEVQHSDLAHLDSPRFTQCDSVNLDQEYLSLPSWDPANTSARSPPCALIQILDAFEDTAIQCTCLAGCQFPHLWIPNYPYHGDATSPSSSQMELAKIFSNFKQYEFSDKNDYLLDESDYANASSNAYDQLSTQAAEHDFYQTVSEMGGGAAMSTSEGSDTWREFKTSLDLDAVRIRQELEREYREKQTQKLLDSHRHVSASHVVREAMERKQQRKTGRSSSSESYNTKQRSVLQTQSSVNTRSEEKNRNGHTESMMRSADSTDENATQSRVLSGQENVKVVQVQPTQQAVLIGSEKQRAPPTRVARPTLVDESQFQLSMTRETNATTSENATPPASPNDTLERKVAELNELNVSVRRLQKEKEKLVGELQSLRSRLEQYQSEIRTVQRSSTESKSRIDEVRSELRNVERKRDAALEELQSISGSLSAKKTALHSAEQRLRKCVAEIETVETLGVSREQIETIIEERNRLIELLQENECDSTLRYELEKQLSASQEQAKALERRLIAEKIEPLERELAGKLQQLRDAQSETDSYRARAIQLEERIMAQEKESSLLLTERQNELESFRRASERDLHDLRERHAAEVNRLRAEYAELERRTQLEKEQALISMKRDLHETKSHFEAQLVQRLNQTDFADRRHNDELLLLRDQFEAEKQTAIRDLEVRLSREQNMKISDVESALMTQIGELNRQLSGKDEEILLLKQRLVEKDDTVRQTAERLKADLQHVFDDALLRERARLLEENEIAWRDEVRGMKEEMQRAIASLNNQLLQEHEFGDLQQHKIAELECELLAERDKQRLVAREKVDAVMRARQLARDELEKEYNAQMEILIQKHKDEAICIRESFNQLERDLDLLRTNPNRASSTALSEPTDTQRSTSAPAFDLNALTWKQTFVFVEEVNDECRKTAALLGVKARVVDLDEAHQMHNLGVQTALHHALANLKASNQLLRRFTHDVGLALEDLRMKLNSAEEEHTRELARVNEKHGQEMRDLQGRLREREREKAAVRIAPVSSVNRSSVDDLLDEVRCATSSSQCDNVIAEMRRREQELHDIKAGMSQWKEETAQQLARELQNEFKADFDRKLLELKSTMKQKWKRRLATVSQRGAYSSCEESGMTDDSARNFDSYRDHLAIGSGRSLADTAALSSSMQDVALQVRNGSIVSASAATKLILHLQDRLKELRVENIGLRRYLTEAGLYVPEKSGADVLPPSVSRRGELKSSLKTHFSTSKTPIVTRNDSMRDMDMTSTVSTDRFSARRPNDSLNAASRTRKLDTDIF